MALNPSVASSAISTAYLNMVNTYPPVRPSSWNTVWQNAYNSYMLTGALDQGGAVAGSEQPNIIGSFFSSLTQNTTPEAFGTMMCNYWATCFLIPTGNTISVTNDASAQVTNFVQAVSSSITTTETTPYFLQAIQNIQNIALPTITWTVTRQTGSTTTITLEKVV